MRGIPYCHRVFGRRDHFGASLPLLELVKTVSLWNPYLDPACDGGGGFSPWMTRQNMTELATCGEGRRLLPGTSARTALELGGIPADGHEGPPGWYPVRGQGASGLRHVRLFCLAPLLRMQEALASRHRALLTHWEAEGDSHQGALDYFIPSPRHNTSLQCVLAAETIPEYVCGCIGIWGLRDMVRPKAPPFPSKFWVNYLNPFPFIFIFK